MKTIVPEYEKLERLRDDLREKLREVWDEAGPLCEAAALVAVAMDKAANALRRVEEARLSCNTVPLFGPNVIFCSPAF